MQSEEARLRFIIETFGGEDLLKAAAAMARLRAEQAKSYRLSQSNKGASPGAAANEYNKLTKEMAANQKATRGNSLALQNASYQVQDFIVQVQGGVDPMRAMGQQMPQLLGGFGRFGAHLGVVAALLPALVVMFSNSAEAIKSMSEETDELDEAMANVSGSMDRFEQESSRLNTTMLKLNRTVQGRELRDFLQSVEDQQKTGVMAYLAAKTKEWGDSIGDAIGPENAKAFKEMMINAMPLADAVSDIGDAWKYFSEVAGESTYSLQKNLGVTASEAENIQAAFDRLNASAGTTDIRARIQDIEHFIETIGGANYPGGIPTELVNLLEMLRQKAWDLEQPFRQASEAVDGILNPLTSAQQKIVDLQTQFEAGNVEDIEAWTSAMARLGLTMAFEANAEGRGDMAEGLAKIRAELNANMTDLERHIDMLKRQEAALDAQAETLRETYDPLYAYQKNVSAIYELWRKGKISTDIFTKAVKDAQEALDEAMYGESWGDQLFEAWEKSFDSFVSGLAQGTTKASDLVKNMARAMIAEFLKIAAYKTVLSFLNPTGDLYGSLSKSSGQVAWGVTPSAMGNVINDGRVKHFARGGVVSAPTVFPMRNSLGLAGEAGPEAIVPLSRNNSGQLGIKGTPVNVTVNNNAAGVAVQTTEDGGGNVQIDVMLAALAGEINRGGNEITSALERSYALGRGPGVYR